MKTKKNKKNGGMIKRESDCLDVCPLLDCNSMMDCVAGSLLLLEYCDFDTSSYLAKRSPNGVFDYDILRMYQIAYDPEATLVKIDDLTDEAIMAILPPSFATILCYDWSKNGQDSTHAVVLFNNGGTLKILDPQKCKVRDRSACSVDLSEHKRKGKTRTNYVMIKSKETSEKFKINKYVIDLVLNKNMYEYPGRVDVIYTSLSPEDILHKAYIVEGIIEKLGSWDKRIYDIEGVGNVNIETERDKIQNRAQENITVKRKRKNDDEHLNTSQTKRRIKLVFKKAPNTEPLSRTATKEEIDRDIAESLADDEFISDLTEEELRHLSRFRM